MDALGLKMRFASGTIDQPGKQTADAAHGYWLGGSFPFDECDTWMLVGSNPLVANSGGIPHANPGRRLKRALSRGFQLIVIDPRRTETARRAALHIQPKPGTDPAILAGIIREVIRQNLCDTPFIAQQVEGLDVLKAEVEPFTPQAVAIIADIPARQIIDAAGIFGSAQKGSCTASTGANMSGWSNITEYLVLCLNSICGRYRKAGDIVTNPGVLTTRRDYKAQAIPPYPIDGYGSKLRVRDFSMAVCGLPTSALADEMLLEGEGQVKALITIGGNPMMAWPDQQKTYDGLKSLELNVCVEPRQTATTALADYVLAPKLPLETPGTTLSTENLSAVSPALGHSQPYGQYVPATVEPPAGSDLLEDWEFFYGLAQHMNLQLNAKAGVFPIMGTDTPQTTMDMENKPSSEDVLDMVTKDSWVPLEALRRYPQKVLFVDETVTVKPADPGTHARLSLSSDIMFEELREFARGDKYARDGFDFRLISRRMPNHFNSMGPEIEPLYARYGTNPAFMHPDDLTDAGFSKGDVISVQSEHATIKAVVWPDKYLRRGLVSMCHCWGENPDGTSQVTAVGTNSGRLISVEVDYARFSGIPLMSALPVKVSAIEASND
ncbi:MAG: molybdopterin-dependent oxidoreductase [Halieaceae bacterium]|nr:molybdopterin-dependent oxidoreductase [Halieaceae bacterium]